VRFFERDSDNRLQPAGAYPPARTEEPSKPQEQPTQQDTKKKK